MPFWNDFRFQPRPELTLTIGGQRFYTASLDFGPHGPLEWMFEFVGRDLKERDARGAPEV